MTKKISMMFIVALALTLVLCLAVPAGATPGEQNGNSRSIVEPGGGAYVIVTGLKDGELDFNYGWNNSRAFASEPLGYWISVYNETDSQNVWSGGWPQEVIFGEPAPKQLKLNSSGTELESGKQYKINFFVRDYYQENPHDPCDKTTNISELVVWLPVL